MSKHDVHNFFTSHTFIKAATAGVLSAGLDNYLNNSGAARSNPQVIMKNATFGSIVAGSIIASDYIAPTFTHLVPIPDISLFSGKTLEHRLVEVSLGTSTTLLVNTFVLPSSRGTLMSQAGIVLLSDFIGEYVSDYVKSRPLSYLS
jgi:hypothetical protein